MSVLLATLGSAARAQIIYSADFNSSTAPGFSNARFASSPDGSRRALGRYGNESATLNLSGLQAGHAYRVDAKVYAFDSWDGNAASVGPDRWSIATGSGSGWTTTFSAFSSSAQAFPFEYGLGTSTAGSGGAACNCGWRCWSGNVGPWIYPVWLRFTAVGPTESVTFAGSGLEDLCNESWGLDDVVVTDLGTTPEPVSDACSTATSIDLASRLAASVLGSTVGANPDFDAPPCPGSTGPAPGVWYRVVGTGRQFTASTCGYSDYDTVIAAYCGTCTNLHCIAANDDDCGNGGSRISFCTRAGTDYYILVSGYSGAVGNFELVVSQSAATCSTPVACAACSITIPPGAIAEGEPTCGTGYTDTFNAGCSTSPAAFSTITPGQTIAGTSGTFVRQGQDYRDTDWYEFVLTDAAEVSWSGAANFPLHLGLIDGRLGCVQPLAFLKDAKGARCSTVSVTAVLQPGHYWAWAAPEALTGIPCGTPYYANLQSTPVGACQIGGGCIQVTAAECATRSGSYQGNATACSQIGYVDSVAPHTFEDIASTGTVVNVTDDGGVTGVSLGFQFGYFDSIFTSVGISPNGYLSFTDRLDVPRPTLIPSGVAPNNVIAPRWSNLNPVAGSVRCQTLGSAPQRRFIVQWTAVPMFGFSDSNTFQVVLFEADGEIQFRYQTVTPARYEGEVRAGIENGNGSQGVSVAASRVANGSTIRLSRGTAAAPVAVPGSPYAFSATTPTITADGSGSYDPDSPDAGSGAIRTVQWDLGADGVGDDQGRVNLLQPISIGDAAAKGLSVVQNVPLRLFVGDASGLQGSDQTVIGYSNSPPSVGAGGPYLPVLSDQAIVLNGTVTDPDLAMGVGEVVRIEWDTSPAVTAADVGNGFASSASITLGYAQLQTLLGGNSRTLYLNAADRAGRVVSAPAVISLALADLQISGMIEAPAAARFGDTIRIRYQVANPATGTARGPWTDRVYLSANSTFEAGTDTALISTSGPAQLASSAGYERELDVVLPVDFAATGTRYLLIRIDDGSTVHEANETNNLGTRSITLSPTLAADLAVTSISAPATGVFGGTLEVAWRVTNQGPISAIGAWNDVAVLSINSVFGDADDIGLSPAVPAPAPVPAAGSYERTSMLLSVPARYSAQAAYRVLVRTGDPANGSPREAERANNVAASNPITMSPTPSVNLRVTEIVAPANAVAGAAVNLRWTVTNTGSAQASGIWTDRVVLRDPAGVAGDIELGVFAKVTTLQPAEAYTQQFAIALPREVDGSRVFVVATDSGNAVAEPASGAESDNAATSSPATTVALPAGPDLVVTSAVPQGIAGVFGSTVNVQLTVRNQGNQAASGTWVDRILLRKNGAAANLDYPLEPLSPAPVPTLAPGAEYTVTVSVVPPIRNDYPDGAYRFVVRADANGGVTEQRETNNELVSAAYSLSRPSLPNLRVSYVSTPAPALPGAPVTVSWTVVNAGDAPATGAWAERLFISTDAEVGNDTLLSTIAINEPLAPGATSSIRTRVVPAPASGLSYRMAVCVDAGEAIVETSEFDNCDVSQSGSTIQRNDLVVRDIAAIPMDVIADDTITVAWTGENVGDAPTPGAFIELVTLVDSVSGTRHVVGSRVQATQMHPGVAESRLETFDVPSRIEGEFRIEVTCDAANAIFEREEGNNTANSLLDVSVSQPLRPNLVVTQVTPPASATVGSVASVSFSVTNTGPVAASGSWVDRVTARNAVTGVEQELAIVNHTGAVATGASYVQNVSVRLPQESGDYFLCVVADSGDLVNEGLLGGEGDNRRCGDGAFRAQTYLVTVVPSLTEGLAGMPVTVSGIATSTSGGAAIANLPVSISLSVRGTVRTYTDVVNLRTNASGAYSYTLPLIAGEAGQYALRAGPPSNISSVVQGSFVLHGLKVVSAGNLPRIAPGAQPVQRAFTLTNTGDLPLAGLAMSVVQAPSGLLISGAPSSAPLPGQQSRTWNVNFAAAAGAAETSGPVRLRFTCSQGATAEISFNADIAPLAARLALTGPSPVRANMPVHAAGAQPIQTSVQFTVRNEGGSPSGPVAIVLPTASWLSLATPSPLNSIGVGESAPVVLNLTPGRDLLNADPRYPGTLQLQSAAPSLTVPFEFTAVPTATSDLIVRTEDEATFYKETPPDPLPPVRSAFVRVVRPEGNVLMASGLTDQNGEVRFDDLPEGDYFVEASADKHQPWRQLVAIRGSEPVRVYPFLSFNAISYSWAVDPIQIEDRYRFTLEAVFETNVPYPVVDVTPRVIELDDYADGQPHQINFTLTNRGLIRAQQVELVVGESSDWLITAINGDVGQLNPGESVTVPAVIQRRPPACPTCSGGAGCAPPVTKVRHVVRCRTDQVMEQAVACRSQPCGSPTGLPVAIGDAGAAPGSAPSVPNSGGDHGSPPIVRNPQAAPIREKSCNCVCVAYIEFDGGFMDLSGNCNESPQTIFYSNLVARRVAETYPEALVRTIAFRGVRCPEPAREKAREFINNIATQNERAGCPNPKVVLLGYSWGGEAAANPVGIPHLNHVITVDPIHHRLGWDQQQGIVRDRIAAICSDFNEGCENLLSPPNGCNYQLNQRGCTVNAPKVNMNFQAEHPDLCAVPGLEGYIVNESNRTLGFDVSGGGTNRVLEGSNHCNVIERSEIVNYVLDTIDNLIEECEP
jgi:subtilase family serine protease